MCYHAALDTTEEGLSKRMDRAILEEARSQLALPYHNGNAFARPWWPVVTTEQPDAITAKQWGLVPKWAAADPAGFLRKAPTFNAISEEAFDKRSFKNAMESGRRCLIPVTSFFEWQHRAVPGRKTPNKVPHRIHLRGADIFCLGGIFEQGTFSILTRPAQTLMATIHNTKKRQPVIIPRTFEGDWLSGQLSKEDVLRFCDSVEELDFVAEELEAVPA